MRAFAVHSDVLQLGLADVTPELVPVVEHLGFERAGAEPVVEGGWLGERWFRAFADARIECVGGIYQPVASEYVSVVWRGYELRVGVA